ncbi:hypothetical protein ACFQH6_14905 [Halobacteriaceae archaeon GCM10025711]
MNVHEALDGLEGWVRSRKPQASVASRTADVERFVDVEPGDVHPPVEPVAVSFGSPERVRSVWNRLPPSRALRIERSFAFPSPVQTAHPENDEVRGVRWHGDGHESASTAIIMNHGAFAPDFTAERLLSVPLLRRDVHVFGMAAPYHMGRAPADSEYSGQYLLSGDVPRFVDGMIQAVADVRALVATLRDEGYDDVYLFGISLGGNVAAQSLTMADVDGGVLAIPAVDFFEIIRRAPIARGCGGPRAAPGSRTQTSGRRPDPSRRICSATPSRTRPPSASSTVNGTGRFRPTRSRSCSRPGRACRRPGIRPATGRWASGFSASATSSRAGWTRNWPNRWAAFSDDSPRLVRGLEPVSRAETVLSTPNDD